MIEVSNLVKEFGVFRAVDDLSFSVPKGQVLGFLGPNGAGKSTTMKVIAGSLFPTYGKVTIDGIDVQKDSISAQKKIGYLPENAPSYGEMMVAEFLDFVAEVRGLTGSEKQKALDRVKEQCFLGDMWDALIETLSKGYRQRVGFAQAVLHDPPALILDEPTDGLDPNQKHEVRKFIRDLGREKTIILSTHILEEVEALCSRVIIIANGKLMADKTPEELSKMSNDFNAVTLHFSSEMDEAICQGFQALPICQKLEQIDGQTLKLWPNDQKSMVSELLAYIQSTDIHLHNIHVSPGRLDEVFRTITQKEG